MNQIKQKPIVRLRWYKGERGKSQVSYDREGNALNENNIVKLYHGALEWKNFLKQCRRLGYVELEVDSVYDFPYTEESKRSDIPQEIVKEVKDAFYGGKVEKSLTPEQKEIAELRAEIERMKEKPVKRKRRTAQEMSNEE